MSDFNLDMANLAGDIANSYAKQTDLHLQQFLSKNKIPFDGDIKATMKLLEDMGMMLIRQDENDGYFGDQTTTYKLVQVIDSTSITIKSPVIVQDSTQSQSTKQER